MIPKTRVAVAVRPLPVPRSLAGKSSGEMAYSTPYIICGRRGVSSDPQARAYTDMRKGRNLEVTRAEMERRHLRYC